MTLACTTRKTKPKKTLRFLPPEAGTIFRPSKARSKSPQGSQGRPAKGPKVPPCQADSLLRTVLNIYDFSTHDAQNKAQKNAAFPSLRGRDVFSPPKSARQEPKKNHEKSRPSSERSESVAVPGRFAFVIFCAQC